MYKTVVHLLRLIGFSDFDRLFILHFVFFFTIIEITEINEIIAQEFTLSQILAVEDKKGEMMRF